MIKKLTEIEAQEMIKEAMDIAKKGKILDAIHDKFEETEIKRVMQIGDRLFHSGYLFGADGCVHLSYRMIVTNLMAEGVISYDFTKGGYDFNDDEVKAIDDMTHRLMIQCFKEGLMSPDENDYE